MTLSSMMHQSAAVIESSLNIRLKTTITYLTPVSGGCLGLAGLGSAGLGSAGLGWAWPVCPTWLGASLWVVLGSAPTLRLFQHLRLRRWRFVEGAAGQKTCTVIQACFQSPLAAQLLPSQWSQQIPCSTLKSGCKEVYSASSGESWRATRQGDWIHTFPSAIWCPRMILWVLWISHDELESHYRVEPCNEKEVLASARQMLRIFTETSLPHNSKTLKRIGKEHNYICCPTAVYFTSKGLVSIWTNVQFDQASSRVCTPAVKLLLKK